MTKTKQTMTAEITHTGKSAYRVVYTAADVSGAGWSYADNFDAAKAKFEKSVRARKYQVEWSN